MEKPEVHTAMQGLGNFLTVLGAKPRYVYLPPGIDGAKVGLDDFFVQGHTLTDVWRCAEEMLRDAPEEKARVRPCITTMDTVERQPVEWLWYPYLALGKICMLDGDPGIGKSLLTSRLLPVSVVTIPCQTRKASPRCPLVEHTPPSCCRQKTASPILLGRVWMQQVRIVARCMSSQAGWAKKMRCVPLRCSTWMFSKRH